MTHTLDKQGAGNPAGPTALRRLTPEEEFQFLRQIYGQTDFDRILALVISQYDVLQARSQTLLSLVAICLTIAGFSGPTIAASSPYAKWEVGLGLALVILAAFITLLGPLQLRWATQWRAATIEESIINLLRRRNSRTVKYHVALTFLIIGISGYVSGTVGYMLRL